MTISRRSLVFAVLGAPILAVGAAPAWAKEGEKDAPAATILLEAVALPIIVDGRLLNYVFTTIKLELFPNADGAAVRMKEQFFRDDLVRVGHKTPFLRPDDYNKVDEAKVRAEILRAAVGIVGANVVKNAVITKQVAQHMLAAPKLTIQKGPPIVP
jgi:hypothetical protein